MRRKLLFGVVGASVLGGIAFLLLPRLFGIAPAPAAARDPWHLQTPPVAARDTLQLDLHAIGLAHQLLTRDDVDWRTHVFEHGHIHYLPGSHAERTIDTLTVRVSAARMLAVGKLGLNDPQRIEVFIVETRDVMRQLVGRPIAGMVQSGERSALLVYNAEYAPFLVHELTHLYSHYHWGPPRHGRWISEGLAMWASGDCQGQRLLGLGGDLLETGRLRTWQELVRSFDRMDEVTANIQAATMVEYVQNELGIQGVRNLWRAQGWQVLEDELDRPISDAESQYRERLKRVRDVGRLDVERLRRYGCQ